MTTFRPTVIEHFSESRSGIAAENEDALFSGKHFYAVIDGATAKTDVRWQGESPGRVAALCLHEALANLAADVDMPTAVACLSEAIQQRYVDAGMWPAVRQDTTRRMSAAMVIFSCYRGEVWLVGDCQCRIGGQHYQVVNLSEGVIAESRAMYLAAALLSGRSVAELQQHDVGREAVLPLLRQQLQFQNNPAAGNRFYSAIDGFPVPAAGMTAIPVPENATEIVLASDGYPKLLSTLTSSEAALRQRISRDPLMCESPPMTKGVPPGHRSFDDRTYLRLQIRRR